MIAIFTNIDDADKFSKKIHGFLLENRPGYNAECWSVENKSDSEDLWMVKIPTDYEKWSKKLKLEKNKDKYDSLIEILPDDWEINEE